MKRQNLLHAVAVIAVGAFVISATPALARGHQGGGSYVTGKGHTGTYSRSFTGNPNAHTREHSITTQGGKTYTRDTTTMKNSDGSFTKQSTGPGGNTQTYTGTGDGNGNRTGTYTTSAGRSGTYDSNVTRNGDGSVTRNNSWTGQNGVTHTNSDTLSYDPSTKTYTDSHTGVNGNTHTGSVSVTPNQ